jgi:uncharacterized protein DUF6074
MRNHECAIIPFPTMHRVKLIKNLAWQLATYRSGSAAQTFARQLDTQREAMARRGIAPDVIEREIAALEIAVKKMHWRITLYGGDAA